jgi:hypothetical protein
VRLSIEQLRVLVIGNVSVVLAGSPSAISDAPGRVAGPGPSHISHAADIVSASYSWAIGECPDVDVDLVDLQHRRSIAVLQQMARPDFLDRSFDDPASADIFDPEDVSVLVTTARGLFESLMIGRAGWFFDCLLQRGEIRRLLAHEHPAVILEGLRQAPWAVSGVPEEMRRELEVGMDRLTSAERTGLEAVCETELSALGLWFPRR